MYKIYPNPTSNKLYIENLDRVNKISIYNIVGVLILQRNIDKGRNEIDLTDMRKGLYIIKIESEKAMIMQKLIKE